MKKFLAILLTLICMVASLPAMAEDASSDSYAISVSSSPIVCETCQNSDGALCIELLPVAQALGYTAEMSELTEGDAYRVVYTLTPAPSEDGTVGSTLMVAYSIENDAATAVAISKDQILLPLKQSMTLVEGKPYMPTEFFETGMCVSLTFDNDAANINIAPVACIIE